MCIWPVSHADLVPLYTLTYQLSEAYDECVEECCASVSVTSMQRLTLCAPARLETGTHQFGVDLLFSEVIYDMMLQD